MRKLVSVGLLGGMALVVVLLLGAPRSAGAPDPGGTEVAPSVTEGGVVENAWPGQEWATLREKTRWALEEGVDTLPLGDAMAALGRTFVGTPYAAGTLDLEGPERVVVNFGGLDCVTFVENVFALARFVRRPGVEALLADRPAAEAAYEGLLEEVRYRGGSVDGYPSRLHYFSDWIRDNAGRGLVTDETLALGGVPDDEPVDFMSAHTDAYRQLADPANLEAVRRTEEAVSAAARYYLPEEGIASASASIRDGDIIAATSTVQGLDVAHTGLALWVQGELRLLHAPLSGSEVQISPVTLAERIAGIEGQDGIMVARPVER